MTELLGKSLEELEALVAVMGEPRYRAAQIYSAIYAERKFSIAEMSTLPLALRERLEAETRITMPVVKQRFVSSDGSVRYLMDLPPSEERGATRPASVEAVFMPSDGRQTICVSTQAGCAVDCQFCLTAQLGLIRNLTAGEILAQMLWPLQDMAVRASENGTAGAEDVGTGGLAPQTNIVLMGQGEPLLNFNAVMRAMRIALDQRGMKISPRHVTLSTSGIVPGIERLAAEPVRPKLAISLNASSDEQRDVLMPINKKYPLRVLLEACKKFPRGSREYITFEYVLLGGVNDTPGDARRVAKLMADLGRVKVNLIPWNPGALPYAEPTAESVAEFHRILCDKGIPAFTRYSRGRDVMAACGQLALNDAQSSPLPVLR